MNSAMFTLDPPALAAPRAAHPMDSARMLLSLLELAETSAHATAQHNDDAFECAAPPLTLRRLISALAYRDEATVLHSRRVALLGIGIARFLGWDEGPLRKLEVAALLHDIGKLGIPDHILHKPGRLAPDEQEFVLLHHYIGVDLLQACRIDREIVEIVWSAHTHGRLAPDDGYDSRGCVSQGARLLAVADAYDSLRNDQSYRRGKSHDETMRILNEQSGKEYDRNVVAALHRWICEEGQSFVEAEPGTRLVDTLAASVDAETIAQAGVLSHVFAFLYLLETLYDGFCLLDADQRFVVWNHGMERISGLKAQQLLGESWAQRLLTFTDQKRAPLRERECPVHRSISNGVSHCQVLQLENRRTARWHEVEVQALPLVGFDGRARGTALLLRDKTEVRDSGQYQQLQMAARRDPLTGVGNRGELESRLARMFQIRSEQPSAPAFAVIFLDLDHFKSINDTYGHTVGDRVLVNLARLISDELYSGETVCRYGGEEFVILCPETDLATAETRAERLRSTIMHASLAAPVELSITASLGVAQVEAGDTIEILLHRADEALYEAKRSGRNRTCCRSLESPAPKSAVAVGPAERPATNGGLVHIVEFRSRVAANIVTHKLSGYVDDTDARIHAVRPNYVDLRLGRSGLFGFWGRAPESQPVRLELEISEPQRHGRWASEEVTIRATVTPLGLCRNVERFQSRANLVLQELRAYFAAT